MQEQLDKRRKAAEKVTIIGAILDAVLGVLKILVGVIANSSALIADGIHSLSDLFTDFLVVIVLRLSHRGPDTNHPWGHARFETVGTVILGLLLVAVGALMAYDSLQALFDEQPAVAPGWPALLVAAMSIVGKEWIFRYTYRVGKELDSDLIIANAWHSRTDAFSSIVVFLAVAGAMAGWWWLDALAAVIVALFIGKIGWDLISRSIIELVDTALPESKVDKLRQQALEVDGVISVHSFKSRRMGNQSLLEMHIQVAPHLSAAEGHYIGDVVAAQLKQRFDDLSHIIFHIDTYDDEIVEADGTAPNLPARRYIEQQVDTLCRSLELTPDYELTLYYHPRYVDIELKLSANMMASITRQSVDPAQLEAYLKDSLSSQGWFRILTVWAPVA